MNGNYELNEIRNKLSFIELNLNSTNNSVKINYCLINDLLNNQIKILSEQKKILDAFQSNSRNKDQKEISNIWNYDNSNIFSYLNNPLNKKDINLSNNLKQYKDSSTNTVNTNDNSNILKKENNNINSNLLYEKKNYISETFLIKNSFDKLKKILKQKKKSNKELALNDLEFEEINKKVNNLNDLIDLCYYCKKIIEDFNLKEEELNLKLTKKIMKDSFNKNINFDELEVIKIDKKNTNYYSLGEKIYSIDLDILVNLIEPLEKLNKMIGMKKIKKNIIDQILYYIQKFNKDNNDLLHTVIKGPPGVGKTEIAKILASILSCMKIIPSKKIKFVKRNDLIGEYLGQTAIKTQKVINESNGGILFIDEAYSLGNSGKNDSYSKECIDILNQNLTENKNKFICIVAGYSNELEDCFFSLNKGLRRRFPFVYEINSYNSLELKNIFLSIISKSQWSICINNKKLNAFFNENKSKFTKFGGDMQVLFMNCKYSHSKRVFLKNPKERRKINFIDLINGFNKFMENRFDENNININLYV
jgi:ATP-dependent Clp protease ATP-binding subunit ClpA